MKAIAHAWLALMALERLKKAKKSESFKRSFLGKNFPTYFLGGGFDSHFNKQAENFVNFFDKHKDAFLKGAWFPDNVIADNLVGGHTLKLKKPLTESEKKVAEEFRNRIPEHLHSLEALKIDRSRLNEKVYRSSQYVLPDRSEALSHAIRDMVLIKKKEPKGSDIMFNDDQITLYFLMLSHYLADAHVPPHCDSRDFYGPSTIHPDMEKYWDDEIKKFYDFDKKRGVFDYDIDGAPELIKDEKKQKQFSKSFLYDVIAELSKRKWTLKKAKSKLADQKVLGENNKKVYDYVKAVCFVSYLISTDFIPDDVPEDKYQKIKILEDPKYKNKLNQISVNVLADAIDSISLVWLLTWDKYNKLKEEVEEKRELIGKEGKV
ncbi:hypothetical protein E3J85_01645 [Patescibacteria group bacterium]|nr:MAG: hypothetical protein E3J85_01645 [Patescibacteria group bacterium]